MELMGDAFPVVRLHADRPGRHKISRRSGAEVPISKFQVPRNSPVKTEDCKTQDARHEEQPMETEDWKTQDTRHEERPASRGALLDFSVSAFQFFSVSHRVFALRAIRVGVGRRVF